MQWLFTGFDVQTSPLFARGRGLGRLIEGLTKGDPMAWTITVGAVVIFGGFAVYKHYNSD